MHSARRRSAAGSQRAICSPCRLGLCSGAVWVRAEGQLGMCRGPTLERSPHEVDRGASGLDISLLSGNLRESSKHGMSAVEEAPECHSEMRLATARRRHCVSPESDLCEADSGQVLGTSDRGRLRPFRARM